MEVRNVRIPEQDGVWVAVVCGRRAGVRAGWGALLCSALVLCVVASVRFFALLCPPKIAFIRHIILYARVTPLKISRESFAKYAKVS